jgi:class 3 adenylate cyclase
LAIRYRSTPENMLATLNIVIPTLMDAAWWFEGEMEKNTGDGLLVYFGMGTNADDEDAALKALGAIRAMRWATVNVITPQLRQRGLRELQITIGADLGDVLLAKIGLRQIDAPLVAVGEVANRAAKIQATCKPGEARIGENLLNALPVEERKLFVNVWPQKPWPFVADRSKLQVASQELEAATRAQDENSRRYWTAVRLGLFQWWPVKPDPVSPTRPYRIYRTKPA